MAALFLSIFDNLVKNYVLKKFTGYLKIGIENGKIMHLNECQRFSELHVFNDKDNNCNDVIQDIKEHIENVEYGSFVLYFSNGVLFDFTVQKNYQAESLLHKLNVMRSNSCKRVLSVVKK